MELFNERYSKWVSVILPIFPTDKQVLMFFIFWLTVTVGLVLYFNCITRGIAFVFVYCVMNCNCKYKVHYCVSSYVFVTLFWLLLSRLVFL